MAESPSPASNSTSCLSLGCPARSLTEAQHLSYTGPREEKKKTGPAFLKLQLPPEMVLGLKH